MKQVLFLRLWSIGTGAMDAATGVLLMFFPTLVLRLLGVAPPSADALVFLSWIGVFVAGVGLSYGMALGKRCRGETVWTFTALVRVMVALFLSVKLMDGSLPIQWAMVAVADAVVGVAQILILRAGWWNGVPE